MALYKVKAGDSPASIARAFTGDDSRMRELVTVNVQKPRVLVGGVMTWQSLYTGEMIQLPASWPLGRMSAISEGTKGRLAGIGLGTPDPTLGPLVDAITADASYCTQGNANVMAFQTAVGMTADGEYGPTTAAAARNANDGTAPAACPQYLGSGGTSSMTPQTVDIATAANTVINDPSICTPGPNPSQSPNQNVLNFQHAYNASGGPGGVAPSSLIDEDGEFGPGTLAALNMYSAANNGPQYALSCANGTLAQAASSGGTSITPTNPSGATTISTTSSSSSSGEMAIVYGGLALLAGAAAFWYLNKNHGKSAPAAKGGVHKAARHVGRGRAKRKAARRRR